MRWWASDHHLGHQNIIEFSNRPFWHQIRVNSAFGDGWTDAPDVEKMNAVLRDNHNDLVADDDEVWFVGDLALGRQQTTVPYFKEWKGRKFLIPGNHDSCHPMHPKYKRFVGLYEDAGFTILPTQVRTEVAGIPVLVCHFPYWEDFVHNGNSSGVYRVDKFSGLRPDDDGGWLIHGHTHSPDTLTKERQIHVGVDAWDYRPVSEDVIVAIMEGEGPLETS